MQTHTVETNSTRLVYLSALILALTLGVSACTKKGDDNSRSTSSNVKSGEVTLLSPVRGHKILGHMPAKTIGFSLLDYTLSSSARWLSSNWSKSQFSFSELTKKLDEKDADVKKLITILEGLEEGGLLPSSKASGNVEQVLAFIVSEKAAQDKELPAFVVIENLKTGTDGGVLLTTAKAKIESSGISMKETKIEGGSSYSTDLVLFRPKEKTGQIITATITIAAKGNRLVVSSSPNLPVSGYLTDSGVMNVGLTELKEDSSFTKAIAQVPESADEFSLSYIDTKKLLLTASNLAPKENFSTDDVNKLPIQSIVHTRSMGDAMVDSGAITLVEDPKSESTVLKDLALVNASSFFTQVPKGLVGLISLDGALIKAIAESALQATPAKERAEAQLAIAPLLGAKEFGIAVRPQKGASPLPELALLLETAQAPSITKTVSALISSGAGSQGFLPPFQTKEVNGVSVQYALSPFGAGVYIGNTDTHVLLASAESLMTELIDIQKGGTAGGLEDISQESKSLLSNPESLATFHVDYSSVAQLIESLSSSLGIFTGGQPLMEAKELEALRNLGRTAVQIVFKDSSLRFVSRSEATKL